LGHANGYSGPRWKFFACTESRENGWIVAGNYDESAFADFFPDDGECLIHRGQVADGSEGHVAFELFIEVHGVGRQQNFALRRVDIDDGLPGRMAAHFHKPQSWHRSSFAREQFQAPFYLSPAQLVDFTRF
jgi:hypothetical protein